MATAMTRSTKSAHSRRNPKEASNDAAPLPSPQSVSRGGAIVRRNAKRTEEPAAARPTQYGHRNRQAEPTPIAEPSRPTSRETGRGEDDKRTRGKQAKGKRQGTDDTALSLTGQEDGTTGRVNQDENMRQRIRYEPAIGSISSGIEYEMARE